MEYFTPDLFDRIKERVATAKTGVRYGFVERVFTDDAYEELVRSFPDVFRFKKVDKQSGGGRKRFYVGPEYVAPRNFGSLYHLRTLPEVWRGFVEACASSALIAKLSTAVGAPFNSLDTLGFTYGDAGCVQEPHLDGAVRPGDPSVIKSAIALLLYFNREDDPVSATELYDLDKRTILAKGTTMRNSMFFFVQHPDSWHGFPQVPEGHERRLISLSYSQEIEPLRTHWDLLHRLIPLDKRRWQCAKASSRA